MAHLTTLKVSYSVVDSVLKAGIDTCLLTSPVLDKGFQKASLLLEIMFGCWSPETTHPVLSKPSVNPSRNQPDLCHIMPTEL